MTDPGITGGSLRKRKQYYTFRQNHRGPAENDRGRSGIVLWRKTEPGVHAIRQIVNFKTASKMSEAEIRQYMNQYLPLDIVIRDVKTVSERFHAELNPHIITYGYRLLVGDTEDVFQRKYVDFRTEMPDIEQMQIAAEQFKGKHDFRVFSTGKTKKSTMRELTDLQILSTDLGTSCLDECRFFRTDGSYMNYKEVLILIKANGFLKQMPQKIIGILLDIGYKDGNWIVLNAFLTAVKRYSRNARIMLCFWRK